MKAILRDVPESFESERLLIRAPHVGDGAALNVAVRESWSDLHPWLPWATGEIPTVEQSEEWVRSAYSRYLTHEDMPLLLFLKESGTLIGGSGLHRMDWNVPRFEIGYWLRSHCTGKGYMTEAVQRITTLCFETLGARRVEIHCDANNHRSAAIPRRLGFKLEGVLRNQRRHEVSGELVDLMIFARTGVDA